MSGIYELAKDLYDKNHWYCGCQAIKHPKKTTEKNFITLPLGDILTGIRILLRALRNILIVRFQLVFSVF